MNNQTKLKSLKEHPQARIIPDMRPDEYAALKADIAERGILSPLDILADGTILDGRHRWRIAWELNLATCPTRIVSPDGIGPDEYMIRAALLRRHLSDDQRAVLALKWQRRESKKAQSEANEKRRQYGRGKKKSSETVSDDLPAHDTRADAAALFSVSEWKLRSVAELEKQAPEALAHIESGEKTLHEAKQELRRDSNARRIAALAENNKPLPNTPRKYNVIYADPPWRYDHPISGSRKIENHYPTMEEQDILSLPVSDLCADDAILFLWVPAPMLKKGLATMEAWGFEYRTQMIWNKPSIGTGQWVRQKHENLLIGVHGNIPTPAPENKPNSVIDAERGGHSEKPDVFYDLIEAMYPGLLRIELFARERREKWEAWGNEV